MLGGSSAAGQSSGQRFGKLLETPIHRLLEQLSTEEAIRLSRV